MTCPVRRRRHSSAMPSPCGDSAAPTRSWAARFGWTTIRRWSSASCRPALRTRSAPAVDIWRPLRERADRRLANPDVGAPLPHHRAPRACAPRRTTPPGSSSPSVEHPGRVRAADVGRSLAGHAGPPAQGGRHREHPAGAASHRRFGAAAARHRLGERRQSPACPGRTAPRRIRDAPGPRRRPEAAAPPAADRERGPRASWAAPWGSSWPRSACARWSPSAHPDCRASTAIRLDAPVSSRSRSR